MLRLVASVPEAARLAEAAAGDGFALASANVRIRTDADTWGDFAQQGEDSSAAVMLVLAPHAASAQALLSDELEGRCDRVGALLGYPACCVSRHASIVGPEGWARALVARSGPGPYPHTANRLAIFRRGLSPIGELYPCSLHCAEAAHLGARGIAALRATGLVRLAESVEEDSLAEVWCETDRESSLDEPARFYRWGA